MGIQFAGCSGKAIFLVCCFTVTPLTGPAFARRGGFQSGAGFVICGFRRASRLFPGSSAVEQPAVNRLVAGSNPARGAKIINKLDVGGCELYGIEVRPGYGLVQTS